VDRRQRPRHRDRERRLNDTVSALHVAAEVTAAEALRRHEAELLRLPDISGVGLGEDEEGAEVIVLFVRSGASDLDGIRSVVPADLDGYRTDIRPEIKVFPGPEEEGGSNGG
jgi:hypothetical protein